jgi:hypothetical protein
MKSEIIKLTQARRLREQHGKPQVIALSTYASDEALRRLRPEDGPQATAAEQRALTEAVAVALRADGTEVRLIELQAADYLRWLLGSGFRNTAARRAQWINLQVR